MLKELRIERAISGLIDYGVDGVRKVWDGVDWVIAHILLVPLGLLLCVLLAPFVLINWITGGSK